MEIWRARVLQASYRGVTFSATESSTTFGRRLAVYDFPKRNLHYSEDMGRRHREYSMSGFVGGENWQARRDALINACEADGPGVLVHQEYGTISAWCQSMTVTENKTTEGRIARFDLVFVAAVDNINPGVVDNTRQQALSIVNGIVPSLIQAFIVSYNVAQSIDYVADSAASIIGVINSTITPYNSAIAEVINTLPSVNPADTQAINVSDPTAVADYVQATVDVMDVGAPSRVVSAPVEAITHNTTMPAPGCNADEVQQQTLNNVLSILRAEVPVVVATTATRVIQQQQIAILTNYYRAMALARIVVLTTHMDWEAQSDAYTFRDSISAYFDTQLDIDEINYTDLTKLKLAFVQDVNSRAPSKPEVVVYYVPETIPGLVLAYDLYEDITREQQIIDRNVITHPGFISPAKELMVLSG